MMDHVPGFALSLAIIFGHMTWCSTARMVERLFARIKSWVTTAGIEVTLFAIAPRTMVAGDPCETH